ncbi:MAG: BACON domain-containing protein [Phycisphaerales bacterium]|nr:BACON domain-containing protein [Phycisphaerales bacterium]
MIKLSTRPVRSLLVLSMLQVFLAGAILGGCGGDLSNVVDPVVLDTWDRPQSGSDPAPTGSGTNNPPPPPNGDSIAHVPQVVTNPITPIVRGDVQQREDTPILYVDVIELNFGAQAAAGGFAVTNVGTGTLNYTVATDVTWATISLAGGSSTGEPDPVVVFVQRANLPPGVYVGFVNISASNGESHIVNLIMTVPVPDDPDEPPPPPAPTLTLSTDTVHFGPDGWTRGFTLANTGSAFDFTLAVDQPWLSLSTTSGTLGAETITVTLTAERLELVTGDHTAKVTIGTTAGLSASVTVHLEKPLTTPLIIPWLEVNVADEAQIEHCVAGLQKWRRVTHTAVVTTNTGREWLYTTLKQRVPDMQIIPGIKTAPRLGTNSFDNLLGWERIATSAALMVANAGVNQLVLENETALMSYWFGGATINFSQLAAGLSTLPPHIEYIWFPSVHSRQAWLQQRSADLCAFVNGVINTRFVDQSICHPLWPNDQAWIQNRATLEALSSNPILPLIYFGCSGDTCFWTYDGIPRALGLLSQRSDVLFYTGSTLWIEAAEQTDVQLWQRP